MTKKNIVTFFLISTVHMIFGAIYIAIIMTAIHLRNESDHPLQGGELLALILLLAIGLGTIAAADISLLRMTLRKPYQKDA